MEKMKDCEHGEGSDCSHPELGGEVKGMRKWLCSICEYFMPKKK